MQIGQSVAAAVCTSQQTTGMRAVDAARDRTASSRRGAGPSGGRPIPQSQPAGPGSAVHGLGSAASRSALSTTIVGNIGKRSPACRTTLSRHGSTKTALGYLMRRPVRGQIGGGKVGMIGRIRIMLGLKRYRAMWRNSPYLSPPWGAPNWRYRPARPAGWSTHPSPGPKPDRHAARDTQGPGWPSITKLWSRPFLLAICGSRRVQARSQRRGVAEIKLGARHRADFAGGNAVASIGVKAWQTTVVCGHRPSCAAEIEVGMVRQVDDRLLVGGGAHVDAKTLVRVSVKVMVTSTVPGKPIKPSGSVWVSTRLGSALSRFWRGRPGGNRPSRRPGHGRHWHRRPAHRSCHPA